MKLAYHYHTILSKTDNRYWIAGYQGVFIDALAQEVDELHLIFHVHEGPSEASDYRLEAKNIVVHDLGPKTSAWKRFFKGPSNKNLVSDLKESSIDKYIFRSPSPLSVFFGRHFKGSNSFFYVVGDYEEGSDNFLVKGFRELVVKKFTSYMGKEITKAYRNRRIIVNSEALMEKLRLISNDIVLIKTTTLSASLMQLREDTFKDDVIKVLYAGRFDWNKGHKELLEGFKDFLSESKVNAELRLVGWEDDPSKPVENGMLALAQKLGLKDKIKFLGRKAVGAELNAAYRAADVYVLPSYAEGFPRTLWEAMGQATPVIASKVGGIPNILSHGQHAYLIEPHSSNEVTKALKEVHENQDFRKKIIKNGFALAKENTLEQQVQNILKHINGVS